MSVIYKIRLVGKLKSKILSLIFLVIFGSIMIHLGHLWEAFWTNIGPIFDRFWSKDQVPSTFRIILLSGYGLTKVRKIFVK